jgi:hypothetical protein
MNIKTQERSMKKHITITIPTLKSGNMKWIYLFLGILITVSELQADPSVDWVSDSYSSFDVIFSGTGLGWTGTVTSPSGLWEVYSLNYIRYPVGPGGLVVISSEGSGTFLGQLPSQYPPFDASDYHLSSAVIGSFNSYDDWFQPVAPINDSNPLKYGYLTQGNLPPGWENPYPYLDWSGNSTISITSIPDVNDVSTWTWKAEVYASGTSLEVVPEPSSLLVFGFGAFGLAWVRRRQR